jgi:cobalamin biosynthetic protein CobC
MPTAFPRRPDLPPHGGDLADAERRFGVPDLPWLDLSTGINPWPYPMPDMPEGLLARLPGDAELLRLRDAASTCYEAPGADWIAAGAGTQAFIQMLPRLVPRGRVAILAPTYGPHELSWRAAGHDVQLVQTLDAAGRCDHAVLVNPNNPDGRSWPWEEILRATGSMRKAGGFIIVDEAFADCRPEASLVARLEPGIVVLRSFGKFFGLAGLRLGFAIAEPPFAALLREATGPWPVSGTAIFVGTKALNDAPWVAATRVRLQQAAGALEEVLQRGGLQIVGGTDLFKLCARSDAHDLWAHLGRGGILVRAFSFKSDWLRVGLPPDRGALARFEARLLADAERMAGS